VPWAEGEFRLHKEKVRVYILARELDVDTKDLLDLCKKAGFDVKNQLSSLDPDQQQALEQLLKQGAKAAAAPAAPVRPATPQVAPDQKAVRNLPPARARREVEAPRAPEPAAPAEAVPAVPPVEVEAAAVEAPAAPPRQAALKEKMPVLNAPSPAPKTAAPAARPPMSEQPVAASKAPEPPPAPPPSAPPAPKAPAPLPHISGVRSPRDLGRSPSSNRSGTPPRRTPTPSTFGHLRPVAPPTLRQPRPPSAAPVSNEPKVLKPLKTFTKEQLTDVGKRPLSPQDLLNPPAGAGPAVEIMPDEDEDGKKGHGKGKKPGVVPGRGERHAKRSQRTEERKKVTVEIVGGHVKDEDDSAATKRLHRHKQLRRPGTQPRKGKIEMEPPITVRSLSEALGIKSVELLFKLRGHGAPLNTTINSTLEPALAELLAVEYGVEFGIRQPAGAEATLLGEVSEVPDNPDDLVPRAPIVTIMGHVDHGKTSLLDKIRHSNVTATEAGGITQVIRAWRVEHDGKPITFLDTPGHEAFTKMRARGAQVTDIAVIVCAADDGVMPQTEEAIQHAKAAGVSLVVAINKVDMPSANVMKTRQQLYGLNVLPDDMGGDTPFVETSAATGKGIDELLEQLSVVAELKELKANPNRPAQGVCLEANLSEGEGVQATLLVQKGTLRRGDVILCGASYGRVRQMYNDLGQPIQEAGPSLPVRITGMDQVPNADDPFIVLPDLAVARNLAENRKSRQQEAHLFKRMPMTLDRLTEVKITELKVILKADFRGSVEAIRKELEKLKHEEVQVKVLEAGIGSITETDVWLALASPDDTMIVGFNAVPDDRARALAEEKGIKIHEYDIIYNLTNDIRAALEGKLKPREEVVHLGRAVVRETFKVSRVGTIAGCYVTQGTLRRNAKIRVIREGVVIYPPAERSAGLESLKRYKDDASEVREGFECGLKVAGYDDVKVGDVIEAYRVEQVQRTL
jgi:translation initiation factor IF-2